MQMTDNCELLSIFPTPVVKFKVPGELMDLVPDLKNRLNQYPRKTETHIISANSYVLHSTGLEALKSWLTARTTEFMRLVLTIDSSATITQSWVNKNTPDQYTHQHPHQNSIVSGVFYMDVPDGNALLVFHKRDNGGDGYFVIEPKYYGDEGRDYTFSSKTYKLPVSTGELVLFPSWLIHSVPVNKTESDRWSLSFNSMTTENLGSSARLTEFIYPKSSSVFFNEQPNLRNGA